MKIVLPLLLKRKGTTVDANRSNYDIHGRGLLDISFGSDEDKNVSRLGLCCKTYLHNGFDYELF